MYSAFGGDRAHKFVQQWLAAYAAGVKLEYSTFKNPDERAWLQEIVDQVVQKNVSVAELYELQGAFGKQAYSQTDFHTWLIASIMRRPEKR